MLIRNLFALAPAATDKFPGRRAANGARMKPTHPAFAALLLVLGAVLGVLADRTLLRQPQREPSGPATPPTAADALP